MTFEVERAGNAANEAGQRQNNDSNAPADNNEDDQPPAKKVKKSLRNFWGKLKKHQTQVMQQLPLVVSILRCLGTFLHPKLS
jgi:hypothetical protein